MSVLVCEFIDEESRKFCPSDPVGSSGFYLNAACLTVLFHPSLRYTDAEIKERSWHMREKNYRICLTAPWVPGMEASCFTKRTARWMAGCMR